MIPASALRAIPRSFRLAAAYLGLGVPMALSGAYFVESVASQPPVQIPSHVAWTDETIAAATRGDAVRGLVLARRCERCHGREGFSSDANVPNLAGIDRLTFWKQMNDFRAGKRASLIMQTEASALAVADYADLGAYYSMLPTYADPFDVRVFPQEQPASTPGGAAARLISAGDGARGIPPCQACHGPIFHKKGAPSLMTQNTAYIQQQLDAFANGSRANDINMPMRSIASSLTEDERQALATYYGSGLANLPVGASFH